jgi:hypothetical protein
MDVDEGGVDDPVIISDHSTMDAGSSESEQEAGVIQVCH